MTFTINTDASFRADLKRGAWAYWIKGDGGFSARDSGVFRHRIDSAQIAELLAFEKAIQVINKEIKKEWRGAVTITLNTDCKWVIYALTDKITKTKHRMLIKAVKHAASGYRLFPEHVKAHLHTDTPRHWVNDWCDRNAKEKLRAYIKETEG